MANFSINSVLDENPKNALHLNPNHGQLLIYLAGIRSGLPKRNRIALLPQSGPWNSEQITPLMDQHLMNAVI